MNWRILLLLNCVIENVKSKDGWQPRYIAVKKTENSTENTRITLCSSLKSESNKTCPKLDFWQTSEDGGSKRFDLVFNGKDFKENYTELFTKEDDQYYCNISLKKATLYSAGKYKCSVTKNFMVTNYLAELTALESDPVCETNASSSLNSLVNSGTVQFWCSIKFRGNWAPVMEWQQDGKTITEGVNSTTTVNEGTVSVLTTKIKLNDKRVNYTCKTYFKDHALSTNDTSLKTIVAHNIPDYYYVWTAPTLQIPGYPNNEQSTTKTGDKEWSWYIWLAVLSLILAISIVAFGCLFFIMRTKKESSHLTNSKCQQDQTNLKSGFRSLIDMRFQFNVGVRMGSNNNLNQDGVIGICQAGNDHDNDNEQDDVDALGYSDLREPNKFNLPKEEKRSKKNMGMNKSMQNISTRPAIPLPTNHRNLKLAASTACIPSANDTNQNHHGPLYSLVNKKKFCKQVAGDLQRTKREDVQNERTQDRGDHHQLPICIQQPCEGATPSMDYADIDLLPCEGICIQQPCEEATPSMDYADIDLLPCEGICIQQPCEEATPSMDYADIDLLPCEVHLNQTLNIKSDPNIQDCFLSPFEFTDNRPFPFYTEVQKKTKPDKTTSDVSQNPTTETIPTESNNGYSPLLRKRKESTDRYTGMRKSDEKVFTFENGTEYAVVDEDSEILNVKKIGNTNENEIKDVDYYIGMEELISLQQNDGIMSKTHFVYQHPEATQM